MARSLQKWGEPATLPPKVRPRCSREMCDATISLGREWLRKLTQDGFDFVRMKVQFRQSRAIPDAAVRSDDECPARPGIVSNLYRAIHSVHDSRKRKV